MSGVHLLFPLSWHSFATPLSFADHVYPRRFESDADLAAPIESERFCGDVRDVRSQHKPTVDDHLVDRSKVEYLLDCAVESIPRAADNLFEHHGNVFRSDS